MRPRIKYCFIVVYSLMALGCGDGPKSTELSTSEGMLAEDTSIVLSEAQFLQNGMTLGNMLEKPFPSSIQVNGMLDVPPDHKVVVSATAGGYIKESPLLIGDVVKKGQRLVTLENPEFVSIQQAYLEVKQQLGYLGSEYERQKTLRDENISSQKSFLKAESEFKMAQAKYSGLKKQLEMLNISTASVDQGSFTATANIYAPISGSVTAVNVSKGTYVSPATPIMEIIDSDHIHLELSVFEKDIMKLRKGQPILFRIPEASTDTFEAKVHLIGTSIGENRTVKVHGHLKEEKGHHFLTGMFVEASIIIDTMAAMALPSEAIANLDGANYVLLKEQGKAKEYAFKRIEVQTDKSYNGFTEIRNPERFEVTDTFLVKGAFDLIRE